MEKLDPRSGVNQSHQQIKNDAGLIRRGMERISRIFSSIVAQDRDEAIKVVWDNDVSEYRVFNDVKDDTIYLLRVADGHLEVRDGSSFELLWTTSLTSAVLRSIDISGEYFEIIQNGLLHQFNKRTGELRAGLPIPEEDAQRVIFSSVDTVVIETLRNELVTFVGEWPEFRWITEKVTARNAFIDLPSWSREDVSFFGSLVFDNRLIFAWIRNGSYLEELDEMADFLERSTIPKRDLAAVELLSGDEAWRIGIPRGGIVRFNECQRLVLIEIRSPSVGSRSSDTFELRAFDLLTGRFCWKSQLFKEYLLSNDGALMIVQRDDDSFAILDNVNGRELVKVDFERIFGDSDFPSILYLGAHPSGWVFLRDQDLIVVASDGKLTWITLPSLLMPAAGFDARDLAEMRGVVFEDRSGYWGDWDDPREEFYREDEHTWRINQRWNDLAKGVAAERSVITSSKLDCVFVIDTTFLDLSGSPHSFLTSSVLHIVSCSGLVSRSSIDFGIRKIDGDDFHRKRDTEVFPFSMEDRVELGLQVLGSKFVLLMLGRGREKRGHILRIDQKQLDCVGSSRSEWYRIKDGQVKIQD